MLINVDELIFNATRERRLVDLKVYRSFKTEILNYRTAKNAGEYNESVEISIIKKMIKQRQDAVEQYLNANRLELADEELAEIMVLEKLLPEPVTRQDIINELGKFANDNGYINGFNEVEIPKKEMSKVIKYFKDKLPMADGKDISNIVKSCTV
jgi:uncharacterized protein YqeY